MPTAELAKESFFFVVLGLMLAEHLSHSTSPELAKERDWETGCDDSGL
jgi:hypothetical protein